MRDDNFSVSHSIQLTNWIIDKYTNNYSTAQHQFSELKCSANDNRSVYDQEFTNSQRITVLNPVISIIMTFGAIFEQIYKREQCLVFTWNALINTFWRSREIFSLFNPFISNNLKRQNRLDKCDTSCTHSHTEDMDRECMDREICHTLQCRFCKHPNLY